MNVKCFRQTCRLYCKATSIMDIKTFVFLDIETTGLPQYEFGTTKITELSLIAVQANHIRLGVIPRVQNKLTLCFNPRKYIQTKATEITGLDNELLELQEEFTVDTVKMLESFLDLQYKPVCLVAHNGNRFDYPILRTEINRVECELPTSIMCVDSLNIFRDLYRQDMEKTIETTTESDIPIELMDGFDEYLCLCMDKIEAEEVVKNEKVDKIQTENETTPKRNNKKDNDVNDSVLGSSNSKSTSSTDLNLYFNPPPRPENKAIINTKPSAKKKLFNNVPFTLSSVYERLTNKVPVDAHRAECDTKLLLECAVAYADRFVAYSNYKAILLSDIPLMKLGKKIPI